MEGRREKRNTVLDESNRWAGGGEGGKKHLRGGVKTEGGRNTEDLRPG